MTMGNIGQPVKEVEFEPVPEYVPEPQRVPAEEPVTVPA